MEFDTLLEIRHRVLWPEKNINYVRLPDDINGLHYGGTLDGKPVSVASIFIKNKRARLRKFATIEEFQGLGLGSQLLDSIIEELKEMGVTTLWCDARITAIEFYRRFNMEPKGKTFFKGDIEYIVMEREL